MIRAKLNSPDAAGIRSGDNPDRLSVTSGMKKIANAAPWMIVGTIKRPEVGGRIEVRAHDEHQREDQERAGGEQPRIDLVHGPADGRREQDREHAHGRQHHAGLRRGVAHVLLQPQRQQHDVAEERAVGERHRERAGPEISSREQSQIDDRMLLGQFPYDE